MSHKRRCATTTYGLLVMRGGPECAALSVTITYNSNNIIKGHSLRRDSINLLVMSGEALCLLVLYY